MSAPEEIVVTTREEFGAYVGKLTGPCLSKAFNVMPGDSISMRGETVVYRPPAPKPAPPIGCLRDEHIDALKRDGRLVLNCETILYEAAPRDEAREAWLSWLAGGRSRGWLASADPAYEAFLAGRASVKP